MKSLAELKKKTEKKDFGDGPKRTFLTLKDGQFFRTRFRQEMVEDGKNFDADKGSALIVDVHSNPLDFKKKLGCTAEKEEFNFECWACDQIGENNKWRSVTRFYINAAVLNDEGIWEPRMIEQGFGKSHIGQTLVDYTDEYGSIVDRPFKFSRSGSGLNDTSYSLIPLDKADEPKELAELELLTFDGLVKYLPYAEQQAFFYGQKTDPAKSWA